jgi:hypothetical protein
LNFGTSDCQVVGGCDLYTTKAAGSDKKLYRNIENSLESQYESLLRLSASLSPPEQASVATSMNLSRSSPFGPLSQASSRRTFAYLIATLNASHPDYDFSHILRPDDFRKEKSLKAVMNNIDSTLYNLRPGNGMSLQVPSQATYGSASSATAVTQVWGPQMWALIDKEMTLKECSIYCFDPADIDEEEQAIWSLNYFFYNKSRKRVTYLYVRGIAVVTHSPRTGIAKRSASGIGRDVGSNKRAKYWLGDRADDVTGDAGEDSDYSLIDGENEYEYGFDEYDDEADDEFDDQDYKSPVRGVSEDIAARMEIE